jgi:8-oxo-dGTP pyrophosphatase MutT (NUDIX family)
MHRQPLLTLLRQHTAIDTDEQQMLTETIAFVESQPDCFERSLTIGHITGSAWIVSPDRQQVVLIHHRKLDRWFQPGGHADGDADIAAVALREAEEETGLTGLRFLNLIDDKPAIFDIDVHLIPARKQEIAHWHYDIRFLLEADPKIMFRQNHETKAIRWVGRADAKVDAADASICRMLRKSNILPRTDAPSRSFYT